MRPSAHGVFLLVPVGLLRTGRAATTAAVVVVVSGAAVVAVAATVVDGAAGAGGAARGIAVVRGADGVDLLVFDRAVVGVVGGAGVGGAGAPPPFGCGVSAGLYL